MNWRRIMNDLSRAVAPMLAGLLVLIYGQDLCKLIGRGEVNVWLTGLGMSLFGAGLTHILRRVWFPYVELAALFRSGLGNSVADAIKALGICFVIGCSLLAFAISAKASTLPGEAERLLPILIAEKSTHWPDMSIPSALAGQVEQESGWRSGAHLHTAREDGYGLAQFTITARFNAIAEIVAAHPRELAGWSVAAAFDPTMQLRAMVLRDRDLWHSVVGAASHDERFAMALAGYNGGPGSVAKRRAICRATAGCDADRWFGNAELHPPQARVAVSGYGKSFADINSEYPRLVMRVRAPKYATRMPRVVRVPSLGAQG